MSKWFHRQLKPTVTKEVKTTLTLYDIYIEIELVRKSYQATLYYSSDPHDRYSDTAIKEKEIIYADNMIMLIQTPREILVVYLG